MEQELSTVQEHMSSPSMLSGVRVTRSLVICVCFVDRCLYFWPLCCLFTDSDNPPLVSSYSSCKVNVTTSLCTTVYYSVKRHDFIEHYSIL